MTCSLPVSDQTALYPMARGIHTTLKNALCPRSPRAPFPPNRDSRSASASSSSRVRTSSWLFDEEAIERPLEQVAAIDSATRWPRFSASRNRRTSAGSPMVP